MNRKILIFLFVCLFVNDCFSQRYGRTNASVFPEFGPFHPRGWIIAPSLTYMMPGIKDPQLRLWAASDSVYDIDFNPAGKLGVGFEFGRFHVIQKSRLISHVELIMGLKVLRGVERFEATLDDPDRSVPYTIQGDGSFSQTYASMSFSAANIKQFGDDIFMENAIGINGDYRVFENRRYNDSGLPMTLDNPTRFIFQAHYRLGFGFRISKRTLIIPSIETPILNIYEYDDLKSTLSIFNSRYRPLIFRVRVFLNDRKAGRKCPSNKPKRRSSESLFGMIDGDQPW